MRRVARLLIISIVVAAISGCAAASAPIVVQHGFSRCPRPALPELPELDPEQHVCSPENLDRLMIRVDRQCWMIEQQDAALDCYERQIAAPAEPGK